MTLAPPRPDDPPERLYEHARRGYEVVQGIKAYVGVMRSDKRMRVMADILLREVERLEREAAGPRP